ncbi:DUF1877 family protein [Streptomyces sp. NPDC053367]|uniref:DUF1877 family protein n=1 Tax=Streptomyces sp. NPDC053367 TaxID=3365700 RepID=UPI0037D6803F
MGYHLHLIAVPEAELREDGVWLAELFAASWDAWSGGEKSPDAVETVIEKDFFTLDHLLCGAEKHDIGPWLPASLLIFGGRPVYHPKYPDPYVLLTPEEVRVAADFIRRTAFEELWAVSGVELAASWGRPRAEVAEMLAGHYADLRDTYGRAAAEGRVVAKYFAF